MPCDRDNIFEGQRNAVQRPTGFPTTAPIVGRLRLGQRIGFVEGVESFDPGIDIATGNFQLSFVKTSGDASAPNTAAFSNGKIWIQVPVKK